MVSNKFYALVAGIGPGAGRSVAIRFGKEYPVVLLARNPESFKDAVEQINKNGGRALGIATDATDPSSLASAYQQIEKEFSGLQLVAAIYNVGRDASSLRKPFLELTQDELDRSLHTNVRGLFHFAQSVVPRLLKSVDSSPYPPTFILTGATASMRGSKNWSVIAAGKSGGRIMTQSLAREFGPQGLHVAHAIIDGGIHKPEDQHAGNNEATPDGRLSPYGIAESYWSLHTQHKSALTQEIDLRPFNERF